MVNNKLLNDLNEAIEKLIKICRDSIKQEKNDEISSILGDYNYTGDIESVNNNEMYNNEYNRIAQFLIVLGKLFKDNKYNELTMEYYSIKEGNYSAQNIYAKTIDTLIEIKQYLTKKND